MRITKAEPRGPALTVYESKITEQTVLNPKKNLPTSIHNKDKITSK